MRPRPRLSGRPPPAQLIAQWKQAAGGAAWDAIRTLHLVGVGSQGGLSGPQEEWTDLETGRYLMRFRRPPLAGADGFDGRVVWTRDASGRAWVLGDRQAQLTARTRAFQRAQSWWYPERGAATVSRGAPPPGAGPVDVVHVAPADGRPFDVWLDPDTHLPMRLVEATEGGARETTFGDYRRVGGVVVPFAIETREEDAAFAVKTTVGRYAFNLPIPAARFAPPRPPADAHLLGGRTSTTVPYTLVDGHIHIPAYVNGRGPFDALLDTGGQAALTPSRARQVGIRAQGAFGQHSSSGTFTQAYGQARSLGIGKAVIDRPLFSVFQQDNAELLLGHEVFQRFVVRVDPTARTVTLSLPGSFAPPPGAVIVPFRFHDRMPEIDALIDGVPGVLAVDSRQSSALDLNAPFVAAHGLVERYHATIGATAVGVVGQGRTLLYARVPALEFAGLRLPGIVSFLEVEEVGAAASDALAGFLGQGLLNRFIVTYDYAGLRLVLEPTAGFDQPDTFPRSGWWLAKAGSGWTVTRVLEHGSAAEAGLKVGDRLLAINGQSSDALDSAALARLTREPPGTVVPVTVERDGATTVVAVVLRDVL